MPEENVQRRAFIRRNQDGSEQRIEITWDKNTPSSTFKLESEGFSGASCITELKDLENIIGVGTMEEKPEMHNTTDPRNVFIVGGNY